MISRRIFCAQSMAAAGVAAVLPIASQAQTQGAVSPSDPQAQALGYQVDGAKVDTKKYPNYAVSQSCAGCALFQGRAGDTTASCAVFANKLVSAKGWCAAWSKKG